MHKLSQLETASAAKPLAAISVLLRAFNSDRSYGISELMVRLTKGIYFWIILVAATLVFAPAAAIGETVSQLSRHSIKGRWSHWMAVLWSGLILRLMPGWTITLTGREHIPPQGTPVVLIANHESMADIWVLYELGIHFRWLSKIELFKIPLIGWAMRRAGYIAIDRGNRHSHSEAMKQCSESLKSGVPVFFFPEGTRSRTGEMLPFKSGAFRLAKESGVPILPVVLAGTKDLLPKGSGLPGKAHVKISVLPMERIAEGLESADELASRLREKMLAARKLIA